VPGVLSSGGGRDFGAFLGALGELGYGWAYRVLDAKNFGVAQRRRRVFVVGCFGGWESAAKVLFESESLSGNIEKGRKSWKETTTAAGISTQLCGPLTARDYKGISSVGFNTNARPDEMNFLEEQSNTLTASQNSGVAQFCDTYNGTIQGNVSATMTADMAGSTHSGPKVMQNMAVRRLTEVECERLQGFPDSYTNIKENCPDGPRYKSLGNSMVVPVMRWIGERINNYERL
jgi:DNA (cytosine-5)-methyltransferase 1